MKEILKLSPTEGEGIIWGDHEEFVKVQESIEGTSRWSVHYEIVVRRLSDGKFFKSNYSVGATEMQDESPYEYDEYAIFTEVIPVEKTIIVYK
jgi:hypothetical protein